MEKEGLQINIKQNNGKIFISLCNKSNYEVIISLIDITILINNCATVSKLYKNNQIKKLKSKEIYNISFNYDRNYNTDTTIIAKIHYNDGMIIFDPIKFTLIINNRFGCKINIRQFI